MKMWKISIIAGVVMAGLFALAFAIPVMAAQAQDGTAPTPQPGGGEVSEDQVNAVASQLFCPVCENVPLDVCGTLACADWRAEIRSMLGQGKSAQEIKDYFASRYGQRVLASPEARGLNTLVWVLPVVGVIVGLIVAIVALRRMAPGALSAGVARGAQPAVSYEDLDPAYVARLEQDLKEMTE
jgi:cytochrome c-type biogenesis protein CcmH